jgi:peptidyl-tRNA hydrolase, PTH1 family
MAFRNLLSKRGGSLDQAEWLVIGLGNPGPQYAHNRHNVGFWVVNELAKRAKVQPKSAGPTMVAGVGEIEAHQVALIKPLTFMNASGKAVAQALKASGCDLPHTIIIYDELDLPTGALRIRAGGGHGGHNGLRSIAEQAGLDFVRIRIGIGRPVVGGEPSRDPQHVADWVLNDAYGQERTLLEETAQLAAHAVETIIREGVDVAGNRYNRK